jgi:mannan endo-1,4-beta-mannosidase
VKKIICFVLILALLGYVFVFMNTNSLAAEYPGFRVSGRFLYDKAGEKVVLMGINHMAIWMDVAGQYYSEIAKTGANCVRIVWTSSGTAEQLDKAIYTCRANSMIPMIESHDATGVWNDLKKCVDYWIRPDIVAVIKKHQEYLLINISNECGDASVSASDFRTKYIAAVTQMRNAGIHVPLIIDGTDWGKNINVLQSEGPAIIAGDPDQNVMFSVHMWWPQMWGYTEQTVISEIAESVSMGLPLIVGEFGGLWEESAQGQIPYKAIIRECYNNQVGWLAWSWGPGNNPQAFLDMTTDSTYATLRAWGLEVAVTDTNSIKNRAVRPASIKTPLSPSPSPSPTPPGNIALNKTVTVSSTESSAYPGSNAVDGNIDTTRWASSNSDPQYITVDLGQTYNISRVMLYWENAYGTQYRIQVSTDGNNWTDVFTEYNGNGQVDDISLTGASGRYVRMYGMQRVNSSWGYSLWEIGIYSSGGVTPTPPVSTATPTPVRTPTPVITATPTAIRTATPARTATPVRTATPIRTATPRVTVTPTPVRTLTPVITATPPATPTPVPPAGSIKVQFYNQNTAATSNQIYLNIKLFNTGSSAITLSNVKLRYYYTVDGVKPQNFWCDWSPVGSSNITGTFVTMSTAKTGADTYVEIGFSSGAGSLAAGDNTTIQARAAKNDWTNYTQTNDYSFNSAAATFIDWTKVTGYISGALQWGTEP